MPESFYVVLPSNDAASKKIYPENNANHWITNFSPPLEFEENGWEVALTSLTLPPSKSFETVSGEFEDLMDDIDDADELIEMKFQVWDEDTDSISNETATVEKKEFIDVKGPFQSGEDLLRKLLLMLQTKMGSLVGRNQRLKGDGKYADGPPQIKIEDDAITIGYIDNDLPAYALSAQEFSANYDLLIHKDLADRLKLVTTLPSDETIYIPRAHIFALSNISEDKRIVYDSTKPYGIDYNPNDDGYVHFTLTWPLWRFEKNPTPHSATLHNVPSTLFVQSDVAEAMRVGGKRYDVLREVGYTPSLGHTQIELKNEHFMPIRKKRYDSIEILLSNVSDGKTTDFGITPSNYSLVKFHFRKL